MNNTLCIAPNEGVSPCNVQVRPMVEDVYSTEPLAVVRPIADLELDEEAIYTSFEEAISGRVLAVHSRLERLSHPELLMYPKPTGGIAPHPSLVSASHKTAATRFVCRSVINRASIRWFINCSLALIFLLLGFDLMGLLVLGAR